MMTNLMPEIKKQKGQKEIKLKELLQEAKETFWKAMKKQVDNNIQTGAYMRSSHQKILKTFDEKDTTSCNPDMY